MKRLAEVASDFHRAMGQSMAALPAHQLRPAVTVKRMAPRQHLVSALIVLINRERTREELAEALQTRHPNEPVYVDDIVRRLIGQGHMAEDADQLGLTDAGTQIAELLKQQAARAATVAPIAAEADRRQAVLSTPTLDAQLLSRSPPKASSHADTAAAPMRRGADAHEAMPSRVNDRRYYRDGRVTDLQGNLLRGA